MEVSPAVTIGDGTARAASVREKRKRINQGKESTKVYNEGDDRWKSEGLVKNDQLKRNNGSTTVASGKRRTCKPSADSHSQISVQKPHLLRQRSNGGSPQHQSRETRSHHDTKDAAASSQRTSPVTVVKHDQITNAANRSNATIKSNSNGDKAQSILKTTRSSSDESKRKVKPPSSEPDEAALLDYPSSEFTDTSSCTVSFNGDSAACDVDMAMEETRSDESDVGEGVEEMKALELNESDETDPVEIPGEETENDRQPEKEECSEEPVPMCLVKSEVEMGDEEEIEAEDKKTESSVSNFDIDESSKNVVEMDPVEEPFNKPGVNRVNLAKSRSSPNPAIGRSGSNKQPTPVKKQHPTFSKSVSTSPKSFPPTITRVSDQRHRRVSDPQSHSKLQCLVDLVMWRYVPKTALIFGIGTFLIVSSSFATNLDISFVSVISYLGLIYLGVIFLYKNFINKDIASGTRQNYNGVGEQDIIWALRLILPYVNETLHKLTALFSGDPGTTMKVAAVLFVMARCGGSITIWKLIKLGFFSAFTLPKLCSSYSTQISGYGKFWVRRFGDAWESCSQKKAVAFGMFSIVWNFSSVTARIWAAFMLVAAVRYYQQSTVRAEWSEAETEDKNGVNTEKQTSAREESWMRNRRQTTGVGMKKAM